MIFNKYSRFTSNVLIIFFLTICISSCKQIGSDDSNSLEVSASPNGGTYNAPQLVTLTANQQSTIYYTMNGENPTSSSLVYTKPIGINSSITLKFFAIDNKTNSSNIKEEPYIISWDILPTKIYSTINYNTTDLKIIADSQNIINAVWQHYLDSADIFYSNSTNWETQTIKINTGNRPDFALDSDNVIHLVFTDNTVPWINVAYYSNSINWENRIDISKGKYSLVVTASPKIAMDSNKLEHVVWEDTVRMGNHIYDDGIFYCDSSSWASPKIIFQTSFEIYSPLIFVDSKNIKHIIWGNSTTNNVNVSELLVEIRYANSSNWNNYTVISRNSPWGYNHQAMAVDKNNCVHVAWEEGKTNNIYYANSLDWTKQINVSGPDSYQPKIAVDKNNIVHLVWGYSPDRLRYDIYYANSLNWTNNMKIFSNASSCPQLAVDLNNIVHVAWETYNDGVVTLYIKP